MMRFSLSAEIDAGFFVEYLNAEIGRRRLVSGAKWAVNQASINQEDVKRTAVPLPPRCEQTSIAEELALQLSSISKIEDDTGNKITGARAIRQATLIAAFRGLLVAQCPDDEPAHVLLDRIATERGERKAATRKNATSTKQTRKPRK
jgi:type I restriction enzyme S subunit